MNIKLITSSLSALALLGTLSFGMQAFAEETPAAPQEQQTEAVKKEHADGHSCSHDKMADCDCKKKHKKGHKKGHKKTT